MFELVVCVGLFVVVSNVVLIMIRKVVSECVWVMGFIFFCLIDV